MRFRNLATLCVLFAATLAARADTIYYFSISGHGNQNQNSTYMVTGTTTVDSCSTPPDTCKSAVLQIQFTVTNTNPAYNMTFSGIDSQDGGVVYVGGDMNSSPDSTQAKFTFSDINHPNNNNTFNLVVPGINENFDGTLTADTTPPPPPPSATPEPSSIALLGTGLLGMAGVLRKRFV